ncbi:MULTISPECIES: PrkA family serine protein kinase [Novacetimonas]|uniref:PrkA family serine protein kinase n=2 Tax=Novacetimonas hansenii TaxID=436 RepID=A0ABQ0SFG5_NOVHA|nr:PrkA family serine protein kinase [Novacetimonas hansenii]EFG83909.1 putative serine protein kinase, PrkA [Novacetimonas hansenii ATCC 23769]MBL7235032.1 PrkA family serine protein kinase [Novacetimonas hansenii]PYD72846.1 PrkA family serine protein kinase [Novacetimonas hansenii]RFP01908.1 PrkA family serine protein kinase [Novacetimonas hansenii]WEQ59208.1 PrkA family serine protein kinase [Novacetimonas hansenii]
MANEFNVFSLATAMRDEHREVEMGLSDYLEHCKVDPSCYATAAERMLRAIGEAETTDTSRDPRLSRIFMNRTVRTYPAFSDFYGMEETIEQIVGFFRHAAQGLEERKQILYLLGPVGGGKSSLGERLKALMEKEPIYALKAGRHISPVFESPLGLFDPERMGPLLEAQYGIPRRLLTGIASPWAIKRLEEFDGDLSRFSVVKLHPSRLRQIAIAKTEPGDDNNQDVSALVGKVDIRQLENYSQNDPDAYSFSGGLNRANQGILEFVEMFKAPIKMLHPLLTATQEGNYVGTENIGAIPFTGVILAHSNEAEWQAFRNNRSNEAFLDRVCVIKVPYCLRVSEEAQIYDKLIDTSSLSQAPCAPNTLEMLARFAVLSRLKPHPNSTQFAKMRVYDGENIRETDPKARTMQEYRDAAGVNEGMNGISTRFAYKVLSATFNHDPTEIAADPVHLMYVLEHAIRREQFPAEVEAQYLATLKSDLAGRYAEYLGHEIQKAYLESYNDYGQNLFDRYLEHADAWIEDQDFKDPDTGQMLNRDLLNSELTKTEKPAGIANPKDFRNEVVKFALRARANNAGRNPSWTSYEKIRDVIEKRMFSQVEDLLPVISFGSKKDRETGHKHDEFVGRMIARGYTERQVRRLVEWYMRVKQSA